jgi:hypothetical protein
MIRLLSNRIIMTKEDRKQYFEKYWKKPENKIKNLLSARKYRINNREKCQLRVKKWRDSHPEIVKEYNKYSKGYARQRRLKVLNHYGNGSPHCVCCGEKEIKFLAIDHKNNDGCKHRKKIQLEGHSTTSWILKNNFPDIFQILCHNCNMAKGFYGECPHKCSPAVLKSA